MMHMFIATVVDRRWCEHTPSQAVASLASQAVALPEEVAVLVPSAEVL